MKNKTNPLLIVIFLIENYTLVGLFLLYENILKTITCCHFMNDNKHMSEYIYIIIEDNYINTFTWIGFYFYIKDVSEILTSLWILYYWFSKSKGTKIGQEIMFLIYKNQEGIRISFCTDKKILLYD